MANKQNAVAASGVQMGTQLANSTVDFRIAVISSDLDNTSNAGRSAAQQIGDWHNVDFEHNGTARYCRFTNNASQVIACIRMDLNGDGQIGETVLPPWNEVAANMDLDGDGRATNTSVATINEAVLGIDFNHDGVIADTYSAKPSLTITA